MILRQPFNTLLHLLVIQQLAHNSAEAWLRVLFLQPRFLPQVAISIGAYRFNTRITALRVRTIPSSIADTSVIQGYSPFMISARDTFNMQPTLLANTWMAAHLPHTKHSAMLCCAGSAGEAAFRNSLDGQFAESGYEHLPLTLNKRRPPTYHIVGTAEEEGMLIPKRRIARSTQTVKNPPLFHHAQMFSNAVKVDIRLEAVTLDMSRMSAARALGSVMTRAFVPLWAMRSNNFMHGCEKLVSVQPPPNLEDVGDGAFGGCTGLKEIDMSALKHVRKLSKSFMSDCTSLLSVKFPPNLVDVEDCVFQGCFSLSEIDMGLLVGLRKLGDGFMTNHTKITAITLPRNLEDLGSRFLSFCISLNKMDLSTLARVRALSDSFMADCPNLTAVKLPPNLATIGSKFMSSCSSLTEVDMSALVDLRAVGESFLFGCSNLTSVKLPPNLEELGSGALNMCGAISEVDMSSLMAVKKLPSNFMSACAGLASIKFPPNLVEVGEYAFHGCTSLVEVDMSMLTEMRELPNGFMFRCTNLATALLPRNIAVQPGKRVFYGCTQLNQGPPKPAPTLMLETRD